MWLFKCHLHISGGKENVSLAEALNQARLPIIDFKTCKQKKFWGDRVRDSMICAGFRDTEDPPAACQVWQIYIQYLKKKWESMFHFFLNTSQWKLSNSICLLPLFSGWLWWSSAVPAGAWPLGSARRGELWPHWLHRGEQTQRVHPHRHLHPLDRSNTHQRLLPALSGTAYSALTANISSALCFRHLSDVYR